MEIPDQASESEDTKRDDLEDGESAKSKLSEQPVIEIIEEDLQKYERIQEGLIEEMVQRLKIEKGMMLDLEGPEEGTSRAFLCMICDNMVIPKFCMSKEDGIDVSSLKLPQCQTCEGLACYACWKNYIQKDKHDTCPSCHAPLR